MPPAKDAAPSDARKPADAKLPDPPIAMACQIVACDSGDCCEHWHAFSTSAAGVAYPADKDLVTSFVPASDAVSASFGFKADGDNGAVGFSFPAPRKVTALRVTMQHTGAAVMLRFVTLEAGVGKSGCAYPLSAAGVANLAMPRYCWGGNFTPEGMSIRLEAKSAGSATMKVTAVRID